MPLIEIVVYEDDSTDEIHYACEKADSLDPQDLQDALTEAFHSIEQDIWYGDECETAEDESSATEVEYSGTRGQVVFLDEVIDMEPFRRLGELANKNVAQSFSYVVDLYTKGWIPKASVSGYDQPDDDGADLLPEFSD